MQMSSVVLDTSVLANFLRIARMDLLRRYPLDFIVTDHVVSEISGHYKDQKRQLRNSLDLLESMIDQDLLSDNEATAIKDQWARKHRFVIKDSGEGLHRFIRRNWISRHGRNPFYWMPVRPLVLVDELHLAPVTEDQLEFHGFVVDDVG